MNSEQIAKVWHCATSVARVESGYEPISTWDDIPADRRADLVAMVDFRRAHQDKPAGFAHDAWVKAQIDAGWVRADCFDQFRKWDNRLKPFAETDEDYRQSVRLLAGIVLALCAAS